MISLMILKKKKKKKICANNLKRLWHSYCINNNQLNYYIMRIKTKFKIDQFVCKFTFEYPFILVGYVTGFKFYNNELTYFVKWGDLFRYPNLIETEEKEKDLCKYSKKALAQKLLNNK